MARVALLLLLPALAFAADQCPWLAAATAGGALGGEITRVTVKPDGCVFTRRGAELSLELGKDYKAFAARCGANATPLKGIGNEAVACGNIVASRVREQAFVVTIQASGDYREKVRKIAELVAGFLF